MISFNYYKYDNKSYLVEDIEHNREDIKAISVNVLSGDEIVTLYWSDGNYIEYDESDDRLIDYYDGGYVIRTNEGINRWLDWEPPTDFSKHTTFGYLRMEEFA